MPQTDKGEASDAAMQRLATAKQADLVLVMDGGRIIDSGTHEELLERNCLYAEIAASQLVGGETLTAPDACTLPGTVGED